MTPSPTSTPPDASSAVHVVIGAARGMGLACARALAAAGGHLVLADVTPIDTATIGSGPMTTVACDLTSDDDVKDLARTVEAIGPVRSLVLAAGVSPTMGSANLMFAVDLAGPARVVAAFEELMAPGGAAVLFASMAAHLTATGDPGSLGDLLVKPLAPGAEDEFVSSAQVGNDSAMAYGWAKRGVISLVRRSATPWGRRGARINSVSPGIIDTPMGRQEADAHPTMATMLEQAPVARQGSDDDIVQAVTFLLSDHASYVTGTDLVVDGGVVAAIMG
jgi:NAD(P)-dependent dehydrogenase (short-subunit alcohol dehydrogenase family)